MVAIDLLKLILGSTVLHPHNKLAYFRAALWKDDWIETVEALVQEIFEETYVRTTKGH
jgi:hypothetical protein